MITNDVDILVLVVSCGGFPCCLMMRGSPTLFKSFWMRWQLMGLFGIGQWGIVIWFHETLIQKFLLLVAIIFLLVKRLNTYSPILDGYTVIPVILMKKQQSLMVQHVVSMVEPFFLIVKLLVLMFLLIFDGTPAYF